MSRSQPLLWPIGRPRTTYPKASNFSATLDQAERGVYYQLKMLGASNVIITSNLSTGKNGQPLARQTADDTGIAVYFDYEGSRHCVAIDRYCEAAVREAEERKHNLLYGKYKQLWAGLMAIKPFLDKPYPDDQRWTPWTRFIEPRMNMMQAAFKGEDIGEFEGMSVALSQQEAHNG